MTGKKVWIVLGSAGEYSDRVEWVASVHESQADAQRRAEQLTRIMADLGLPRYKNYKEYLSLCDAMREHDPQFAYDPEGTDYGVIQSIMMPSEDEDEEQRP